MNRNFLLLLRLLVPCFFLSDGGQVRAAVVYQQTTPSQPFGAYSSNDSGSATDQKIADNFLFNGTEPVTIRSLRFIGGYGDKTPPPLTPPLDALPSDNFRVVFYGDSGGAPGTQIIGGDFNVGAPVARVATDGPLLNAVETPLEYLVDLGPGITLSSGTVYWVSIVNNPGTNYGWAWARGAGLFDQQIASTLDDLATGPWSVGANGGMYFELSDNNVPEPSSVVMALTSAFGVTLLLRYTSFVKKEKGSKEKEGKGVRTIFLT